jgi:hypothetical protein
MPCPLELSPYLLGNPSSVSWRESPSALIPGWLYTDLPPFSSPFPFLPPQRFPFSNACPSTTTLRYRLHIVRYVLFLVAGKIQKNSSNTFYIKSSFPTGFSFRRNHKCFLKGPANETLIPVFYLCGLACLNMKRFHRRCFKI